MTEAYYRAEILAVTSTERTIGDITLPQQQVRVRLETGGTPFVFDLMNDGDPVSGDFRPVTTGERVIVLRTQEDPDPATYSIFDLDRTGWLEGLFFGFVLLVVVFGRKQGALALVGAAAGLLVLLFFVVPKILAGESALGVSLFGSAIIACATMLLAHGFRRRTFVALAGTLLSLACVGIFAWIAVTATQLTGLGTDDAFLLQFGPLGSLNLQGLLLAGIIIGAMGALDDVTTAQSAVVAELKEANPTFGFRELYRRGLSVGHEHIASLVNTLLLAYVGASFPMFLLLTMKTSLPLWVSLNSEFLAQEIVRTLVGSAGLVLAVPMTTALAAWIESRFHLTTATELR